MAGSDTATTPQGTPSIPSIAAAEVPSSSARPVTVAMPGKGQAFLLKPAPVVLMVAAPAGESTIGKKPATT